LGLLDHDIPNSRKEVVWYNGSRDVVNGHGAGSRLNRKAKETEQRRDVLLKRMLDTPQQPRKAKPKAKKKAKPADQQ